MAGTKADGGAHASADVGSGPALCANDCGFYGSATTGNLCSRCYKLQKQQPSADDADANTPTIDSVLSGLASMAIKTEADASAAAVEHEEQRPEKAVVPTKATKSRCEACRKKVGLVGFACRCGGTYCGMHRHADAHACGFDYKAAGREQIARHNPLVVAPKIAKI